MEYDYWAIFIIPIIVGLILKFIPVNGQSLYSYITKRITRSYNNTLSNIKHPYEIPIVSFTNISATFHGSLEDGFFSAKIVDSLGDYNWCEAKATVKDLSQTKQTGVLNFKNEKRTITWSIQPKTTLTKGRGKLVIGVFEDKGIIENGHISENRPHVALEERKILLT